MRSIALGTLGVALAWIALPATAGEPSDTPGRSETLPEAGDHWVWVSDRMLYHSVLFDGDSGDVLGMIDGSVGTVTQKPPLHARTRGEVYSVDIAYSRGLRGDRLDFVTIYDTHTLSVAGEIPLPTQTADSNTSIGHTALLDGDRFLVTFNQFPNASVSVVDLEMRTFVAEILVTGCAGVYPVGERRFATLCGDGTAALVELDEAGRKRDLVASERFFDPVEDPISMAGVRRGAHWIFVSFEGYVHEVDFAADAPRVLPPWSLFDETERSDGWRVGGLQPFALHARTGRLYALAHRGERGSHKDAGPWIRVFDLDEQRRVETFEVPNLTASFLVPLFEIEPGGLAAWAMHALVPSEGAHSLVVTEDDAPLLFARNNEMGVVAVLDARTGEHLRDLTEAGLSGPTLGVH